MATRLRIGIAGLGRMGRRHAENLARACRGASLVAACSPVATSARGRATSSACARVYERLRATARATGTSTRCSS